MFVILRIYNDCTSSTELAFTIQEALRACDIYLEDPDCWGVKIWDKQDGKIILDYWRK